MIWLALAVAHAQSPPPIVGGRPTDDHPAVGALVGTDGEVGELFCSGTLVAPDKVLTAAHCAALLPYYEDLGLEAWFAVGDSLWTPGGVDDYAVVTDETTHPDYDAVTLDHDLAVLELDVALDPAPVELSDDSVGSSWVGRDLLHVGWGTTSFGAEDSGVKREVTLAVIEVYPLVLVSYDGQGRNVCSGDSGGPVIDPVDDQLVGVSSFVWTEEVGEVFCEEGGAGSARIDVDLSWIERVVGLGEGTGAGGELDTGEAEPTTGAAGQLPEDDAGLSCGVVPPAPRGWIVAGTVLLLGALRRR